MTDPVIAQNGPYPMELEAGEYWWCACGHSKTQPFCDGSHQGTGFNPVQMTLTEKSQVYLCGCKYTSTPPFCDGSHDLLEPDAD